MAEENLEKTVNLLLFKKEGNTVILETKRDNGEILISTVYLCPKSISNAADNYMANPSKYIK